MGERAHLGRGLEAGTAGLGVDAAVDERRRGGRAPRVAHGGAPVGCEPRHRVTPRVVVVARRLVGRVAVVGEHTGADRPVGAKAADRRRARARGRRRRRAARRRARGGRSGAVATRCRGRDVAARASPSTSSIATPPCSTRRPSRAKAVSRNADPAITPRGTARMYGTPRPFSPKPGVRALRIGEKCGVGSLSRRRGPSRARGSCGTRAPGCTYPDRTSSAWSRGRLRIGMPEST